MTLVLALSACQKVTRSRPTPHNLATITIDELGDAPYDQARLVVAPKDQADKPAIDVTISKGRGKIEGRVAPGVYTVELRFFAKDVLVYSSIACGNPPHYALKPGANSLPINICDAQGAQVNEKKPDCVPGAPSRGPRQLRLLSNREYQNTVRDLFAIDEDLVSDFPKQVETHGIDNLAGKMSVTEAHADAYYRAASKIATKAIQNLSRYWTCSNGESEELCRNRFVQVQGARLFRGPLSQDEQQALQQVFAGHRQTGASLDQAIQVTLEAMLMAPRFLYRFELGQDIGGGAFALGPFELAQALSYLYWASTPDDQLLRVAASGEISKPEVLKAEAARLLSDARARTQAAHFASSWLGSDAVLSVNKDTGLHPQFQGPLRASLSRETREFFTTMVFDKKASFSELFSSASTVGDAALAQYYGATSASDGRIVLDPAERRGLLGHASILAAYAAADQTSPIRRGLFVLDRLLCQDIPPPPPDLVVMPPPIDPNATTRERFARHSQDQACSFCHQRIDGIGFGLEDMNEIGLLRQQEKGRPIDASGTVFGLDGADHKFHGAVGLSQVIASSKTAELCLAKQYYRRGMGYLESQKDACTIASMHQQMIGPSRSVLDLLLSLPAQEAFRIREER